MDVRERATYRVQTFGGLVVSGGDAPLAGAATQRKTLLLLAVLAASGPGGISREKLLGLFWPDSDETRARNALKQALHILRRDLRDPELVEGTATLRLNPASITSDVQELEDALARGDLERAVSLYRGPFLDGLYADGSPELERWIEHERGRHAHGVGAALERLAESATATGDHAAAVAWWRRRAAADPLSSRVAVALMRSLVAAGEPEAALQHARVHELMVRQELETPPDPAVAALVERVRDQLRSPAASPPAAERVADRSADPDTHSTTSAVAAADAPPVAPPLATMPYAPPPTAAATPRAGAGRSPRRWAIAGIATALALGALAAATMLPPGRVPGDAGQAAADAPRSVAVLPFVDMSAEPGNEYFGDGLTEELITALAHVEGLRVAARTSSFSLRDAKLDVRTMADTLGVSAIVEGSVRRDGDRLRVTAQLIDAATGYHLWADEYDRELKDVLAVQDEIAGAIARALRVTLVDTPRDGGARLANAEAYDAYLRGVFYRSRISRDALDKAVEQFDRAIALDSTFALAYAGKASALGPRIYFDFGRREEVLPALRAAAHRALELDPRLGEAHVALGIVAFFYDWDWATAEREFRRATELNPGDPHAHHMLANWFRAMGRSDEAVASRRRALELDPLNARTVITLARDYMAAGQIDLAEQQFRHALEIDPDNPLTLGLGPALPAGLGDVHEREGRPEEAVDAYMDVAVRRGASPADVGELRRAFAEGGMSAFWRRWLTFEEREANGSPRAIRVAAIHAKIGDTTRALDWLERALAVRDPGLVYAAVSPDWENVRSHPRFAAILERLNLRR